MLGNFWPVRVAPPRLFSPFKSRYSTRYSSSAKKSSRLILLLSHCAKGAGGVVKQRERRVELRDFSSINDAHTVVLDNGPIPGVSAQVQQAPCMKRQAATPPINHLGGGKKVIE